MSDLSKELFESKQAINSRLKEVGDNWNFDNLTLKDYNDYFLPYAGSTIEELRDSALKNKGRVRVANVMGGTKVLRDLEATDSYALRLTDDRDHETKRLDAEKNITLFIGNVLSKKKLNQIPNDLDIVLCMPAGAWSFLPYDPDFFYYLGDTLIKKMAVNGTALIQLPYSVNSWMGKYEKEIKNVPGLSFDYFPKDEKGIQSVVVIRKTSANAKLPIINLK